MSGHSKWQTRIEDHLPGTEGLVQYTRGYLLALEDVLDDAEECLCLDELIAKVKQTQQQANQTLRVLVEKLEQ